MTTNRTPPAGSSAGRPKPLGMVGAGALTSMLWKSDDDSSPHRYRFNLFRTARGGGRVTQLFTPADLIHFVKLAQVLAAVIVDDGCLDPIERGVLKRLAADLDELWSRFPKSSAAPAACRTSNAGQAQERGGRNGDATHP